MDIFMNGCVPDSYQVGDDSSSDEEANSSDDDIDYLLNEHHESDSDSFEKEMERELNKEFMEHRNLHLNSIPGHGVSREGSSQENVMKQNNVYDDAYFSSGSEDEDNVGGVLSKSKERRKIQTNDELLYDPNMDEENEIWVKEQREGHQSKVETKSEGHNSVSKSELPSAETTATQERPAHIKGVNSDAILSCPACLTTLCIDCQRHDIYKQQFRAMFVMNCNIVSHETLRYEAKKYKKKTGKKKQNQQQGGSTSGEVAEVELYNPVQCALCNTEVAVYDKEEIYHFFNVVESLS